MRNVVRPAPLRTDRLQIHLPEQAAKHNRRLGRAALQQYLKLSNAGGDPLLRRNRDDGTVTIAQRVDLDLKPRNTTLDDNEFSSKESAV